MFDVIDTRSLHATTIALVQFFGESNIDCSGQVGGVSDQMFYLYLHWKLRMIFANVLCTILGWQDAWAIEI